MFFLTNIFKGIFQPVFSFNNFFEINILIF
jgi:hypothetical protein